MKGAKREVNEMSRSMVIPKNSYKVSVTDMVNSHKKIKDEYGIKGYHMISYNPHLDKSRVATMHKDDGKPKDYISTLMKEKSKLPSPT